MFSFNDYRVYKEDDEIWDTVLNKDRWLYIAKQRPLSLIQKCKQTHAPLSLILTK